MDIALLLALLGGIVDSQAVIGQIVRKLRGIDPLREYVDLLDEQFKTEREHSRIDISLERTKMTEALHRASIDFTKVPLEAGDLDKLLNERVTNILLLGTATTGRATLDKYQASAMVKRAHEQFFARIKSHIPELADILQQRDIVERLRELKTNQQQHTEQLDRVEHSAETTSRTVIQNAEQLAHVDKTVEKIHDLQEQFNARFSNTQPNIVKNPNYLADEVPQQGSIHSKRQIIIQTISDLLTAHTWVAILGQTGSGKTGLASGIYRSIGDRTSYWVTLVGQEGQQARHHLRTQLITIAAINDETISTGMRDIALAISSRNSNCILVLDNLPDPADAENRPLYIDLQVLATTFAQNGISIISTSQWELPSELRDIGRTSHFHAPPFTEDEIAETLRSANAPAFFLSEVVIASIRAATGGLAALVPAYIGWYQRNAWPLERFAETIVTGEPALALREESQRKILRLFDPNTQSLLLRLSLLVSDFDTALVNHLAQVPESIPVPQITFSELKYVCITQLSSSRFQISPLFKDIGLANLPAETQQAVASSAADFYIKSGRVIFIDQIFAVSVYLWKSQRQREYVTFLSQALMQVTDKSEAEYLKWATVIPPMETVFAPDISVRELIVLRAQQFRVASIARADLSELYEEVDRLIALTDDKEAQVYAYMMTGTLALHNADLPPSFSMTRAIQHTFRAVQLMDEDATIIPFPEVINSYDETTYGDEVSLDIGDTVWFVSAALKSLNEANAFLNEVFNATKQIRDRIFASRLAAPSLPFILDQFWAREIEKPEGTQDWAEVIRKLDEIITYAEANKIEVLKIAATRSLAIAISYATRSADPASTLLEGLLPIGNQDLSAWIITSLALMHNDFGQPEEAIKHIEALINSKGQIANLFRTLMRRLLVAVNSKLMRWQEAKVHARQFLKNFRQLDQPEYVRLEVLGELAFVHWKLGDLKRLSSTLFAIFKSLQDRPRFSVEEMNEFFNKFANATGQYLQMHIGLPIDETKSVPVVAGYFTGNWRKLRTHAHRVGNTLVAPAVHILELAIHARLFGISYRLWEYIHSSIDLNGTIYKLRAYQYGASLEIASGSISNAFEAGRTSLEFKSYLHRQSIPTETVFHTPDIDLSWDQLDAADKTRFEAVLRLEIWIPTVLKLLTTRHTRDDITEFFREFKEIVSSLVDLQTKNEFLVIADYFERLFAARETFTVGTLQQTREATIDGLALFITHDRNKNIGIRDKLHIQAQMALLVSQNRRYFHIEQSMHILGRFLHAFWLDAITRQRFRFAQPDNFHRDLLALSPRQGQKTVKRILELAAYALGYEFDLAVKEFIQAADTN